MPAKDDYVCSTVKDNAGTNPVWKDGEGEIKDIPCCKEHTVFIILMDKDTCTDDDVISYTKMEINQLL